MRRINIFNFPEDKIYVLLTKEYRKYLIEKSMQKLNCKNYFELSLSINKHHKTKFNGGDIKYWLEGKRLDKRTGKIHPKFMPLWLVLKLLRLNNERMSSLYEKIISYRSGGRGLRIKKPLLPIKITPELDSIVIHLLGDGAAGDFTPSYTQKNKKSFDNFIKKLENSFGKFERSIYFIQGKYQIKFPKAITDILSNYYSIRSYKSHDSKIPTKILERKNREYKLACIVSFIVDEGHVRDVILFYNTNKELIYQIRRLVSDCGYSCSEIGLNKKTKIYNFSLKNKDIQKFYGDLQKLSKKIPTCNLSFKDEDVRFIIKRRDNKNPRKGRNIDNIILDKLCNRNLTTRDISKLTGYACCTILHHLENLYHKKKINRKKGKRGAYLWQHYSEFGSKKDN
jgi:hypothetical protein